RRAPRGAVKEGNYSSSGRPCPPRLEWELERTGRAPTLDDVTRMTPAERWVEEAARATRPARVVWCDGSAAENERLLAGMLADGTLLPLDQAQAPGCTLHRSHPTDVARTEHVTFIASRRAEDAGPTNAAMAPAESRRRVWPLFEGAMQGRTMYVVPYVMGPLGS